MAKFVAVAKQFVRDEEGASMVEYGLLVALIAVVCIVAVGALGGSVSTLFTNVSTEINKYPNAAAS